MDGLAIGGVSAPMTAERPQQVKKQLSRRTPDAADGRKPTRMERAKAWTPEIEDQFRLQNSGFKSLDEYVDMYGEPERWPNELGGFISKTQLKSNGYFVYWRKFRECEDKHLAQVKIYYYD
uniref:Meiosis expressed gene 1 protein homolog n=2 Tax=Oxyrrhis marina TaxID=2969 RepID=MEIG1_OXYMA|nr:RecName: Full=Meiosis expressed gene 1 protein homolog [Oxyrrhis marina]ABV22474.1 meiosis expressed protein 1-like protein [Oxyrrhis marina]|mmetsp:Transcript_16582/g.19793  ORF Transcript_16582/g.19793 Transcript_16582/m.19793 type:complete len:121 (-) Transcript_16582:157-519(-)